MNKTQITNDKHQFNIKHQNSKRFKFGILLLNCGFVICDLKLI